MTVSDVMLSLITPVPEDGDEDSHQNAKRILFCIDLEDHLRHCI